MAEMCIDLLSYGLIDSYALRTMGGYLILKYRGVYFLFKLIRNLFKKDILPLLQISGDLSKVVKLSEYKS